MAKNHKINTYFSMIKRDRNFMSHTAITHHDSKCAGLQTKDAIEQENINIPSAVPDEY